MPLRIISYFFWQELFLALGKWSLGLTAYLYHNNHGWEGDHPMTSLMQGAGALAILITGIVFMVLIPFFRRSIGWGLPFVIWLAYHGMIQSLAQLSSAVVAPDTDVAQALGYLEVDQPLLSTLSVLATLTMAATGTYLSRALLLTAGSPQVSNPLGRLKLMFYSAILPGILGIVLIVPFRVPPAHQAFAPVIITMIGVSWMFGSAWFQKIPAEREPNSGFHRMYKTPLVGLLVLLIFFRLVLAPGVTFYP